MAAESDERTRQYIAALERERRSPTADHAAIDAELERVRPERKAQYKQAERRPREAPETR